MDGFYQWLNSFFDHGLMEALRVIAVWWGIPVLVLLAAAGIFGFRRKRRLAAQCANMPWNHRRLTILNPNGNTFDLRYHLPVVSRRDVPSYFKAGRTLEVDGDTLTVFPGRKKEQRFVTSEIASVVTAPIQGTNRLCSKSGEVLFSFPWDTTNAALLVQHLMNRKVRFVEMVGKGETVPPELPEFPRSFAVGKRRLSIDGETIRWKRPLGRAVTFSVSQVASTAIRLPEEKVELLDRDGKVLAWYRNSMENADYMHNYLVQSLDSAGQQ